MTKAELTKAEREGDPHEGAFKAERPQGAQEAPDGGPQTDRRHVTHRHMIDTHTHHKREHISTEGGTGGGATSRRDGRRSGGEGAQSGAPPEKDSGPKGDATSLPVRARLRPERYNQHYRLPIMTPIIDKRGPLRYAQGRGSGKTTLTTEPRSHRARRRAVAIAKGWGSASRSSEGGFRPSVIASEFASEPRERFGATDHAP